MPADIRVYLNERGLSLAPGATARDAVRTGAPELLPDCEAGQATITDARALPVALDEILSGGAILRVQRSARRAGG